MSVMLRRVGSTARVANRASHQINEEERLNNEIRKSQASPLPSGFPGGYPMQLKSKGKGTGLRKEASGGKAGIWFRAGGFRSEKERGK